MRLIRSMTVIAAAALLAAMPGHAQAPASPAVPATPLARMRQDFEAGVRKATVGLNEYFERRLASLETDLAGEGDYAQARLVKQRRDEIAAAAKALGPVVVSSANVPLPVDAAKLVGTQVKNNDLQGWRTATSSAEWTLPKLAPGTYRLELSYSMEDVTVPTGTVSARSPVSEAEFTFHEVTLLASQTKNTLPVKIASNKGVMTAVQIPGVLQLAHPPVTLRLGCGGTYPMNTIAFRDLRLVPVTPTTEAAPATTAATPVAAAPSATLAAELKKLKDKQGERLLGVRKPLVDAYLAELKKLAATAKDEAAEAIETEQHRVAKLATTATLSKANSMGLDGYEDLTDVHYVDDPANTGDHFKVEQNGKQFRVRLAWVASPPVEGEDKRVLKRTMDGFGIDEPVALMLGGSAREFTQLYLQARPLRLLLRTAKSRGKDDTPMALVFLEDIGLFQKVLIDNGFAVVDPPANPGRGGVETTLIKSLQEREEAARKHQPGQGGWALGTTGGPAK